MPLNLGADNISKDRIALLIRAQYLSEQITYLMDTWNSLNLAIVENGTDKAINEGIRRIRTRFIALEVRLKELEGMRK